MDDFTPPVVPFARELIGSMTNTLGNQTQVYYNSCMPVSTVNFKNFLNQMHNQRLLHLGHKDADCDALGSAYVMSRILPGDVGFAQGLKTSAQDLASWLGIEPLIDPDPNLYDYTILYDTNSLAVLGLPLPAHFALVDHHVPGFYRHHDLQNELIEQAEWGWVHPLEATCAVLIELLLAHDIQIDRKMAVALAAGILTDTAWMQLADANTLRHLAAIMEPHGLTIDHITSVIDGSNRRRERRSAILNAFCGAREILVGEFTILVAETNSHDNGFALLSIMKRLGSDICAVGFPKNGQSMVMVECTQQIVEQMHISMAIIAENVARASGSQESWGTQILGRVIAEIPQSTLLDRCVSAVAEVLS